MKKQILIITLAILLVLPLVIAGGTITNVTPVLDIPSFIAGDITSTEFSFDYPNVEENYNDAPLVARINIESLNPEYPVWKGDFELQMIAEQYWLFDLIHINTIPMECEENAPIKFKPKDRPGWLYTINEIPDGTFYCYNPNYYMMQLDSHDEITLYISSDPALYPGEYSVSVELLEMEPDYEGPEIELIEPSGDEIFSEENEIISVKLNITDMYNINDDGVRYKIVDIGIPSEGKGLNITYYDSGWIHDISYDETSGLYEAEFNMTEHGLNESGAYWIYAEAKDILGNLGKL
jgi:hypothetical protein